MRVRHERNVSKQREVLPPLLMSARIWTNPTEAFSSLLCRWWIPFLVGRRMPTLKKTGRMTKTMSHEAHLREITGLWNVSEQHLKYHRRRRKGAAASPDERQYSVLTSKKEWISFTRIHHFCLYIYIILFRARLFDVSTILLISFKRQNVSFNLKYWLSIFPL